MEQFRIQGKRQLEGELPVFGAKNHALKLIPASFLSKGETEITNLPFVEDVLRLLEIVECIGGTVKKIGGHGVRITPPASFSGVLPRELVPTLRASIVLIGPLLARYGMVELPHPGGDNIGKRPINFFLDGFTRLGATVRKETDRYLFSAKDGLRGATIVFPQVSVTATETLLMAAILAEGKTVLKNAAMEPEIVALVEHLKEIGAHIEGAGTHTITIEGGGLLHGGATRVIPDRIEAGSFIMLAAATASHVTVTGTQPEHVEVPLSLLESIGVPLRIQGDTIEVLPAQHPFRPLDLVTHAYPGFPTDLQPPMTVLLTQAEGESMIHETVYEARLFYTDLLRSFGANIALLDPHRALVHGASPLYGTTVESPDVRAGIAMVMAGLIASGETIIQNIYHIDRGYERIEQRLQSIGANIQRFTA